VVQKVLIVRFLQQRFSANVCHLLFVWRLRFVAKLKSNDLDEKALAQNLLFRIVGNLAIFRVHITSVGEYGLEVYANNPETGGTALQHAYQYLVICKELPSEPLQMFPALPSSALGPQPSFDQCGLSTVSHIDPYIVTESGDLQLSFGKTQPLRVTSQLSLLSENPAKDCSEYILQQGGSDTALTFMLKVPQPGMYKVFIVIHCCYTDRDFASNSMPYPSASVMRLPRQVTLIFN